MEAEKRGLVAGPAKRAERLSLYFGAGAVIVGILLRFVDLDTHPFWVGEIQEIVNARQDRIIMRMNEAATDLVGFIWHYLVWRTGITENLEFWHRLLSALCGAATIPGLFWLGKRVHSSRVGAGAAMLLACSFFHVYHSQDARALSYMTFGITWTHLGLIKVVFDRDWRWSPAVILGALFLGCSHVFGFITFALICTVFFGMTLFIEHSSYREPGDRPVRRLLLVLLPAVFMAAWQSWGSILFVFFKGEDMGAGCPDGVTLAERLRFFSVLFTYYSGLPGAGWVLSVLLALAGAAVLWWKEKRTTIVLLAWFFIPATLLTSAKLSGKLQRLDIYHLLHLAPVFLLAVAAGLDALVRAVFARLNKKTAYTAKTLCTLGLALAMAIGFNADTHLRYRQRETRLFIGHDFRSVAGFLDENGVGDQDILAFDYSIQFVSMNFYLGRHFHDKRGLTPFKPDGQLFEETSKLFKLRMMFHSGDPLYDGDIPLLMSQRVFALDDWISKPPSSLQPPASSLPYSGTVWMVMPHEESMEEICGISAYSKWFTRDEVYIDVGVIPKEDLPVDFKLKRFAGVDLVWKSYSNVPRSQVVAEIQPILLGYAPTMADAFFKEFRPSLSDPRERGLK